MPFAIVTIRRSLDPMRQGAGGYFLSFFFFSSASVAGNAAFFSSMGRNTAHAAAFSYFFSMEIPPLSTLISTRVVFCRS